MEKIIDDVKLIETEDGFRIEIKGDKEAIRKMLDGCGSWFSFGRGFQFDFDPGFWDYFKGWYGPRQEAEDKNKKA